MLGTKILALLVGGATALMAFAGPASATLTSPAGWTYSGEVVATSTNIQLDGTVNISCKHSEAKGAPISSGATSSGSFGGGLSFTECSRSVTVTEGGGVSVESNGTVRSTGARVTVQTTILGFPIHCIYSTNNTKVGTLTEGVSPAVMHIGSASIPQESTSGGCGNDAVLTGTYTVTTPFTAIVVD